MHLNHFLFKSLLNIYYVPYSLAIFANVITLTRRLSPLLPCLTISYFHFAALVSK